MANPNCCFMIIAVTFFSPANRRGAMWLVEWKEFLTKVPVCRGRRIRGMENFSGKTLPIKSQNRWAFFYFGHWKKARVQKTNQFLVNLSEMFSKVLTLFQRHIQKNLGDFTNKWMPGLLSHFETMSWMSTKSISLLSFLQFPSSCFCYFIFCACQFCIPYHKR